MVETVAPVRQRAGAALEAVVFLFFVVAHVLVFMAERAGAGAGTLLLVIHITAVVAVVMPVVAAAVQAIQDRAIREIILTVTVVQAVAAVAALVELEEALR
jgi:hypothetical protein